MRCARTNNHTVREAACACIAELAAKIGADAVAPHVPAMLRTLLTCLRDDSWPVSFPLPCHTLRPWLQACSPRCTLRSRQKEGHSEPLETGMPSCLVIAALFA